MEKTNNLEKYLEKLGGPVGWLDFNAAEIRQPIPQDWKIIDSIEFDPDPWLVSNIIPREGITILASITGEGKSMLIMHVAKCLSEGSLLFGNSLFETKKSKVLYINLEMSVSEMQRRGRLIGFDRNNENLIILNEDDFNLNEKETDEDLKYKWLLTFILEKKINVLIIDTFRPSSGGLKEDRADEVRQFFQKFQVLKNSGVSVIFAEHMRKPTQFEGKVPRKEQLLGSTDKSASVEVLLMLRKDDSSGEIHLYQRKNRLGVEIKPFAIKLVDTVKESGRKSLEFQYIGEIDDDATKKAEAKELVLELLASGETRTTKEFLELTKKQVGQKNLRLALSELEAAHEIDRFRQGKQYAYLLTKSGPPAVEGSIDIGKDSFFPDTS